MPAEDLWPYSGGTLVDATRGRSWSSAGTGVRQAAVGIAAYILANPVRAGLMPAEDVWPYSGGTLIEATRGRSW